MHTVNARAFKAGEKIKFEVVVVETVQLLFSLITLIVLPVKTCGLVLSLKFVLIWVHSHGRKVH